MKKRIAFLMVSLCLLLLAGCKGPFTETDYPAAIMVDGKIYLQTVEALPGEVDESAILGCFQSYTDTYPEKDGQTNISKDLIDAPYAKVEGGIAILFRNEWYLCTPYETEMVSFHDKTINKSDLSTETLEWIEWYNELNEMEQLSISYVPGDLLELCGYIATEDSETEGLKE